MAASGIRAGCTEKSHKHRPVALRLPGKKPIIRGFYGVNC